MRAWETKGGEGERGMKGGQTGRQAAGGRQAGRKEEIARAR